MYKAAALATLLCVGTPAFSATDHPLAVVDTFGYSCIPEHRIEEAFGHSSKGMRMPQTCMVDKPCEHAMLHRTAYYRLLGYDDTAKYEDYVVKFSEQCRSEMIPESKLNMTNVAHIGGTFVPYAAAQQNSTAQAISTSMGGNASAGGGSSSSGVGFGIGGGGGFSSNDNGNDNDNDTDVTIIMGSSTSDPGPGEDVLAPVPAPLPIFMLALALLGMLVFSYTNSTERNQTHV